eukprot:CAMPEP_0184869150 /NCGR_PEP_ID=MMETSP0580-20130426/33136_1 /TAXON_ID=1118495 /ORGANISM="Dactyliosolen fragilissimus" /LENGTH=751 /DNA_ID=CAMNT_0027370467 /DNA_START=52 /DNA_END=2304 /DNA_ORIENTATION=-
MSLHSTTPRRELLGMIEEKERELGRMRQAIETAVESEAKALQEKLDSLRRDFEHNLQILASRDELIRSLRAEIENKERSHTRALEEYSKESERRMDMQAMKIKGALEEEYREKLERDEEEVRRRAQLDLEERLDKRKRSMSEMFEKNLVHELKKQEERLTANFDKEILGCNSKLKARDEETMQKIRIIENEHKEMFKSAEATWKDRESAVLERYSEEINFKAEQNLNEMKRELDRERERVEAQVYSLSKENLILKDDLTKLEQDFLSMKETKRDMGNKIEELLDVLEKVERGYVTAREQFKSELIIARRNMDDQLQHVDKLTLELDQMKEQHRNEVKGLQTGYSKKILEIKGQSDLNENIITRQRDKIKELKGSLKRSQRETEERLNAANDEIRTLNDNKSKLIKEGEKLFLEISSVTNNLDNEIKASEGRDESHKIELSRLQHEKSKLQEQLCQERETEKNIWDSEKQELQKEKANMTEQIDSYAVKSASLEAKVTLLQSQLHLIEKENRNNLVSQSQVGELLEENKTLKDIVAAMRREMEHSLQSKYCSNKHKSNSSRLVCDDDKTTMLLAGENNQSSFLDSFVQEACSIEARKSDIEKWLALQNKTKIISRLQILLNYLQGNKMRNHSKTVKDERATSYSTGKREIELESRLEELSNQFEVLLYERNRLASLLNCHKLGSIKRGSSSPAESQFDDKGGLPYPGEMRKLSVKSGNSQQHMRTAPWSNDDNDEIRVYDYEAFREFANKLW